MISPRKRLLGNLGANTVSQIINTAFQLLSVPMFIQAWGMSLYGEWLLLSTVPAYLALSDMGFGSVAANKMTMNEAAADRLAALRVFQSSWVFISTMCLIMGLALFGFWKMDPNSFLNLNSIPRGDLGAILFLFGLFVITNLQVNLLYAGFRAIGHNALSVWLDNLSRILEISLVAIILFSGGGPVLIATAMVVTRALTYFVARWRLKAVAPWIVIGIRHANIQDIVKLVRPAVAFMGFPIAHSIKNQGFLMLVAVAVGPSAVVPFNTARTLVNAVQQVINAINNSVWPEMSRAFGADDINFARKLHRLSCRATLWITLALIASLAVAGRQIYGIWTLGEVELDSNFFMLMLVAAFINSFWRASSVVLVSTNRHEMLAVYYVASCCVAIALSYTLVPMLGLIAVPLGITITEMVLSIYVVSASLRQVQDTFPSFLMFALKPQLLKLR